ncbi:hypothetical protein [Lactococcus petauri]|nr:hypothetical protein [Lactococcus petauri]MDC0826893.1 hypothetical protein [Lactococcus petauri]
MKWKNNFDREYGRIAVIGLGASEAARKLADAFCPVLKVIRELQKANEE